MDVLSRYPFLKREGARALRQMGLRGVEELREKYPWEFQEGARVVLSLLKGERPDIGGAGRFLVYLSSKMFLSALCDPVITGRYVNFERDALQQHIEADVERWLSGDEEAGGVVERVLRDLNLNARVEEPTICVPVVQYTRHTSYFRNIRYRLYMRPVAEGMVILDMRHRTDREIFAHLVREAYATRLRTEIECVPALAELYGDAVAEARLLKEELLKTFSTAEFEKGVAEAFPPCVKAIIARIKSGENVEHHGRFFLATFLNHVGYSEEEILSVFSSAPDFEEDKARYQVEHITGKISGKVYSVPKCATLRAQGLCVKESYSDSLCEKDWLTHPLKYYRVVARRLTGRKT